MRIVGLICTPSPSVFLDGIEILVAHFKRLLSRLSYFLEVLTVQLLSLGDRADLQRAVFKLEKCVLVADLLVPIVIDAFQGRQVFRVRAGRLS